MLNLHFTDRALATFHTRFTDEALPESLSTAAFEAFDRSAYDSHHLALGARAWQLRALDEYRSQVAFTELLMELTELGLSFDVLGSAVRVVRDEARHVELCRRMVVTLGGDLKIPESPAYVRSEKRLPLRGRIVRTLIGSLCIGETMSVRLLAAVRERATCPLAHEVITCLLADESIHSRFGWTVLALLLPHLDATERADIEAIIPEYLKATAEVVKASAPAESSHPLATAPSNPFGSLPASARAEVFRDAVERDIVQPFRALGIRA